MPKNRNSGTIAGRTYEIDRTEHENRNDQEMSDRLERRLQAMDPITVEIDSRTRHRRERVTVDFVDRDQAEVNTEGGSYRVNIWEGTCTCPDYMHRQGRCRHVEAMDVAREQARQGIMPGSREDIETSNGQVLSEHQRAETAAELRNAARARTDDDFFYTEHPDVFESDMARLQGEPVPYTYENVLNGSDITFGIELEFVHGDSDAIAAELYQMGICGNDSMSGYHGRRVPGKWALERDGSVTSGSRGGELISPILTDTPETWRTIEKVCDVAKRHGAQVNFQTGGHVHIGASEALDGKKQRWRRLFKMGAGFEQVYKRISGGEQGVFRGGHYAASSEDLNRTGIVMRLPGEGDTSDFFSRISRRLGQKYRMINFTPLGSKKTVEFRGFNGTLTPGVIQANVKFAAGMVLSAERSRLRSTESLVSTDSDKKRANIINAYEENNQRSNEAIMRTLDVVFSRKEDKQHVLSVIAKNSWSRH
ncbi:hypothetical protein D1155_09150 [Anaerotruncus sp. 80]|uniref:SWIM-type domain-containing protein n=1 Tax=Anaerotruncus colihominis TaxID=169435 RepID=A0A845QJQ9_9FIRM|nr:MULTISPECIES: amidoligase family protein [Anaerotruncus]NBH61816.1 hypothetical protein [Anaerotruncus colihominis]NCF02471.1 hypothetical protein [Anaerotruncus sp. 80]